MRRSLIVVLACLLSAGKMMAGGFNINEAGARAIAMGNAVTAQAYDASVLFYNPAGLAFLQGTQFYGGTTLIFPRQNFVGASPIFDGTAHETRKQVFPPSGLCVTHQFNDLFSAGISLTSPFGLGVEWQDDFPGRGLSQDVDLASFYISPIVALKLHPNFSIAGGVDFVLATVELNRSTLIFGSEGSPGTEVGAVQLKGTSNLELGFTAGVMYRTEKLGLGASYRHSITNTFEDADATFTLSENLAPKTAAFAQGLFIDQNVNAAIDFPNYFSVGIYYKLTKKLGVEVDYAWYGWSEFEKVVFEFDDNRLNQTLEQNYHNSSQVRVGVHYEATDKLSLRAGYIYDETPQPIESVTPLLADDTRNDFAFGVGYKFGSLQLDAGFMFVDIGDRSTVEDGVGKNENGFNGVYTSKANLFFVSFGYTIK